MQNAIAFRLEQPDFKPTAQNQAFIDEQLHQGRSDAFRNCFERGFVFLRDNSKYDARIAVTISGDQLHSEEVYNFYNQINGHDLQQFILIYSQHPVIRGEPQSKEELLAEFDRHYRRNQEEPSGINKNIFHGLRALVQYFADQASYLRAVKDDTDTIQFGFLLGSAPNSDLIWVSIPA